MLCFTCLKNIVASSLISALQPLVSASAALRLQGNADQHTPDHNKCMLGLILTAGHP